MYKRQFHLPTLPHVQKIFSYIIKLREFNLNKDKSKLEMEIIIAVNWEYFLFVHSPNKLLLQAKKKKNQILSFPYSKPFHGSLVTQIKSKLLPVACAALWNQPLSPLFHHCSLTPLPPCPRVWQHSNLWTFTLAVPSAWFPSLQCLPDSLPHLLQVSAPVPPCLLS